MNKEGWLKVGVVGVPICAYIMLVHLPTPPPTGTPPSRRRRFEILTTFLSAPIKILPTFNLAYFRTKKII